VVANPERIGVAVVGAGGVGGLLGALLIRQGDDVTFVAPEPTVAILNAQGLRVDSGRYGSFAVPAKAVTALTASVDVCVVAVKAMHSRPRWSGCRGTSWVRRWSFPS
jgi:2-dehydropantoate 2-reductase